MAEKSSKPLRLGARKFLQDMDMKTSDMNIKDSSPLMTFINDEDFLCQMVNKLEAMFSRNMAKDKKFSGTTQTRIYNQEYNLDLHILYSPDDDKIARAGAFLCASFGKYDVMVHKTTEQSEVSEYFNAIRIGRHHITNSGNVTSSTVVIFLDSISSVADSPIHGGHRIILSEMDKVLTHNESHGLWRVPKNGNLHRLISEVADHSKNSAASSEDRIILSGENGNTNDKIEDLDESSPGWKIEDDRLKERQQTEAKRNQKIRIHTIGFVYFDERHVSPAQKNSINTKMEEMSYASEGKDIYRAAYLNPYQTELKNSIDMCRPEIIIMFITKHELNAKQRPIAKDKIREMVIGAAYPEENIFAVPAQWALGNDDLPTLVSPHSSAKIRVYQDISDVFVSSHLSSSSDDQKK